VEEENKKDNPKEIFYEFLKLFRKQKKKRKRFFLLLQLFEKRRKSAKKVHFSKSSFIFSMDIYIFLFFLVKVILIRKK
jgi:hypothetical protein